MADRAGAKEKAQRYIEVAGERFEGLDKPKRTPGASKKFAVAVKNPETDRVQIVRFGDPSMENYRNGPSGKGGHGDEGRRENFKSRHNCSEKTDKTTPGYWSCRWSWVYLGLVTSEILSAWQNLC